MEKYCKKCDTTKPVSEFHKAVANKDGLAGSCKECRKQEGKEWYQKNKEAKSEYYKNNKEKAKKRGEEWRKNNPDKVQEHAKRRRTRKIERTYGMTIDDYNDLLAQQNNCCAICGGKNESGRSLSVDHDHSCCKGKETCGNCVRQLLCGVCNRGLGFFKDNPELLREAANYLERHSRSKKLAKIL